MSSNANQDRNHSLITGYGSLFLGAASLIIACVALSSVTEVKGVSTLQANSQTQIDELVNVMTQQKEMLDNIIHADSLLVYLNASSNKTTTSLGKQLVELTALLKVQEKQNISMQRLLNVQNEEHLVGVDERERRNYTDSVRLQISFDSIVDFENRLYAAFHHPLAFRQYNLLDQTWDRSNMKQHMAKTQSWINEELNNSYLNKDVQLYRSWRALHDWISKYFAKQKNYYVFRDISINDPERKYEYQMAFISIYRKFVTESRRRLNDSREATIFDSR